MLKLNYCPCSSIGRACGFGPQGWRFESSQGRIKSQKAKVKRNDYLESQRSKVKRNDYLKSQKLDFYNVKKNFYWDSLALC